MKEYIDEVAVTVILIVCLFFCVGAIASGGDSARKSKPPVKITDPNDIKNRTDICYGTERDSRTNTVSDGEATPEVAYTIR